MTESTASPPAPAPSPPAGGAPVPHRLEFRRGEPVGHAVQRVVLAELDLVIDALRSWPDRDAAIHRSRQAMKRVRAVLRLVRDDLGYFAYRQENVVIRDVGRRLSEVRARAVHLELVGAIATAHPDLMHDLEWQRMIGGLRRRLEAERSRVLDDHGPLADLITTVLCARARVASHPLVDPSLTTGATMRVPLHHSWEAIAPGVRRVYRRGRKAMSAAARRGTAPEFHLWRKRVKYLRHQMEALHGASPEVIGGAANGLRHLGDLLGDEHDLAEVAAVVDHDRDLLRSEEARRALLNHLDQRRRQLQAAALKAGGLLYHESPRAFTDRIGAAVGPWLEASRP